MAASADLCQRIDLAEPDGRRRLDELRGKLMSQGDVVSPASRQRTIDVFGEPLSPREVVTRICEDVRA
jgi:histidinol dehydrogenase